MKTDYEDFRQLEESEKISKVREYYIQKARKEHKVEMPWWMGEADITNVNLSFYNDLKPCEKDDLTARTFILFPSVFSQNSSLGYKEVALWLCNHYSLLCYNMRDSFSAGGKMTILNGKKLEKPYPQVVKRLLEYREQIESLLKHPDENLLRDIKEYWSDKNEELDFLKRWKLLVEKAFKDNSELKDIPILELIETEAKPC